MMQPTEKEVLILKHTGIKYIADDELFRRIKGTKSYFISTYGRVIRRQKGQLKLLKQVYYDGIAWAKIRYGKKCKLVPIQNLVAQEYLIPIKGKNILCKKKGCNYYDSIDKSNHYCNLFYCDAEERAKAIFSKIEGTDDYKQYERRQQYASYAKLTSRVLLQKYTNMIYRCAHEHDYLDVEVCPEWRANPKLFKQWILDHYYKYPEPLQIDKDLLSFGQLKEYAPHNCVLLPKNINNIFREVSNNTGYPGVSRGKQNGKPAYVVVVMRHKKYFHDLQQAIDYYSIARAAQFRDIAKREIDKGLMPTYITDAILRLADYYEQGGRLGDSEIKEHKQHPLMLEAI